MIQNYFQCAESDRGILCDKVLNSCIGVSPGLHSLVNVPWLVQRSREFCGEADEAVQLSESEGTRVIGYYLVLLSITIFILLIAFYVKIFRTLINI